MRFAFVFCAISTFVLLHLGQCRPVDLSCSDLQTLDTNLESLLHLIDQAHANDQSGHPDDLIARLDDARSLIESSSDLVHQKKDQQCHSIGQGAKRIDRRQGIFGALVNGGVTSPLSIFNALGVDA